MSKLVAIIILATVTGAGLTLPASAGSLLGNRGIIRGSVGSLIEKHVNLVATSFLRTATVAAGATAGAVGDALVGTPETYGAVGAAAGDGASKAAAGDKL